MGTGTAARRMLVGGGGAGYQPHHNHHTQHRPSVAAASTTAQQQDQPVATSTEQQQGGGSRTLLSLSPTELAAALGGNGRARMVWRALAEGFDPQETDPGSPLFDGRITPKTRALLGQRLARPGWRVVERVKSR